MYIVSEWACKYTVQNNTYLHTHIFAFIDINDDPELTNLPTSINVLENLPLGTSVFQASATDTDSSDPKVFRASFNKDWAAKYFRVDSASMFICELL